MPGIYKLSERRQTYCADLPPRIWASVGLIGVFVAITMLVAPSRASAGRSLFPPPIYPEPFAAIGHGRAGGYRWSVLLYRHNGRPCLDLTLGTTGFADCMQPAPISLTSVPEGHGEHSVTLFAALTRSNVKAIGLIWEKPSNPLRSPPIWFGVEKVGEKRSVLSEVSGSLRIGIKVVRGPGCLRQFVGSEGNKRKAFVSGPLFCDESG